MPLYEYQCDACAHRFEVIQKFSDAPIEVCPKCGSPVHKLLSSPAIQFKGSGWYITDYARAGKSDTGGGPAAKTESNASAPADASTPSAKGDTKDTKAETKVTKSDAKPSASTTSD